MLNSLYSVQSIEKPSIDRLRLSTQAVGPADNDPDMTTLSTPDHDLPRYTITEAAKRLGISREALRLRVRRGRVLASKSNGQWYVHLPAEGADTDPDMSPDQTPDVDQGGVVAT